MPTLRTKTGSKDFKMAADIVDIEWLRRQLEEVNVRLLLLDCRSLKEYNTSHIRDAMHVTVPPLMLRRLQKGNLNVESAIMGEAAKERFTQFKSTATVVAYDSESHSTDSTSCGILGPLIFRLKQDGVNAFILRGGSFFPSLSTFISFISPGE